MNLDTFVQTKEVTETSDLDRPVSVEAVQKEEAAKPQESETPISHLAGTIKQKDLLDALSVVIKAISSRSTLPILANVHITLQTIPEGGNNVGKAILLCTNLEIAVRREVSAIVEQEGSYTVPAKLLKECVNNLSKDAMITLTTDENSLHLASGKRRYQLKGTEASEFPNWPMSDGEENTFIELSSGTLQMAINETEFAAADDESRPVFTGVHCELSDDRLTMATADAFRLTIKDIPLPQVSGRNVSILIPVKSLRTLAVLLPPNEKTTMHWDTKRQMILFRVGATQIVSRLIEATFPNVRGVVPRESHTTATIERKTLTSALKGLAPFARDSSNLTRLSFKRPETASSEASGEGEGTGSKDPEAHVEGSTNEGWGTVSIEAMAEDVGGGSEVMEAHVEGSTDGEIFLNYHYLSDVLTNLHEDSFTFSYTNKDRPLLIRPLGRDDYWYVLMPMSHNR